MGRCDSNRVQQPPGPPYQLTDCVAKLITPKYTLVLNLQKSRGDPIVMTLRTLRAPRACVSVITTANFAVVTLKGTPKGNALAGHDAPSPLLDNAIVAKGVCMSWTDELAQEISGKVLTDAAAREVVATDFGRMIVRN